LDDLKEARRYWKLEEQAQDRTLWRTHFGRSYGLSQDRILLELELGLEELELVPAHFLENFVLWLGIAFKNDHSFLIYVTSSFEGIFVSRRNSKRSLLFSVSNSLWKTLIFFLKTVAVALPAEVFLSNL
jgi:hypothetical protein